MDTTPPTFTNFVIDTPTIDTTSGPDTVRFAVEGVQDDLSGVIGVFPAFNNPDGSHNGTANCRLDTGTALNGTWKCESTIPQFSQGGTYELLSTFALQLIDDVDNRSTFSKSDLDTLGFDTTFFNDLICGNGTLDSPEECDEGADNGEEFSCCTDSCEFVAAATECGASLGICDVAEFCDGANPTCPVDVFVGAGVECRGATDICDVAETCTGSTAACPPPDTDQSGFPRPADGRCDIGAIEGELVSIPTLSEWGLIAMVVVLGIVGFMVMRRRKITA